MRLMIILGLGLLIGCGEKDEEDTAVESGDEQ
jgi:hypothetical protein